MALFIGWLVGVLSLTTAGLDSIKFLNAERLEVAHYAYIQSLEWEINPAKFINLINCESRFEKSRWGDCEGGYGKDYCDSFGVLQFQNPTFWHFVGKYKIKDIEYGNWKNQIDLSILALKDGNWNRWQTCSKFAKLNLSLL